MSTFLNIFSYSIPLVLAAWLFISGMSEELVSFSVVISLVSIATYSSNFRMDAALLAANKLEERRILAIVSLLLSLLVTPLVVLAFISIGLVQEFSLLLLAVFIFSSAGITLKSSLNSKGMVAALAIYNVLSNSVLAFGILSIVFSSGFLVPWWVVGCTLAQIVVIFVVEDIRGIRFWDAVKSTGIILKRYWKFPALAYPSIVLSTLALQFVNVATPKLYPDDVQGVASALMAWRIAGVPISVLAPALSHEFVTAFGANKKGYQAYAASLRSATKLAVSASTIMVIYCGCVWYVVGTISIFEAFLVTFSIANIPRLGATVLSPVILIQQRQEMGIILHFATCIAFGALSLFVIVCNFGLITFLSVISALLFMIYVFHLYVWGILART